MFKSTFMRVPDSTFLSYAIQYHVRGLNVLLSLYNSGPNASKITSAKKLLFSFRTLVLASGLHSSNLNIHISTTSVFLSSHLVLRLTKSDRDLPRTTDVIFLQQIIWELLFLRLIPVHTQRIFYTFSTLLLILNKHFSLDVAVSFYLAYLWSFKKIKLQGQICSSDCRWENNLVK